MTKEQKRLLFELAQKTLDEMGGRGTVQGVAAHLRSAYPDVFMAEAERGWIVQVRNALRRQEPGAGLPAAVSVGEEYVQLKILTPDEYEHAIVSYLQRAKANKRVAHKMADRCFAIHGVVVDVDALERGIA